MKIGKYITIEGVDGCRKSTHAKKLYEFLSKKTEDCVLARELEDIPESKEIGKLVLNPKFHFNPKTELLLFQGARNEFIEKGIESSLKQGKIVLATSSGYTSIANQGYGDKVDMHLIKTLNHIVMSSNTPDIVYLIDADLEIMSKENSNSSRFLRKGMDYHKRVREGYLKMARENPDIFQIITYQTNNFEAMQNEINMHASRKLKL